MKRITVLITVYNRKEKTLRCLQHLYACKMPEGYAFKVYLTDDGCTDGTAEAVRNLYPDVQIIQGDGTLYWNRGMWTAWNEAAKEDYDFYLWLNDDTFLYPIALEKLIYESGLHDDKAIVVGATENSEKTEITYGGYVNGKRQTPQGEAIEVEYFNGNVVLIPRAVFWVLGNLDYYYNHSLGDFDYGLRAKENNIAMFLCGGVLGECELHPDVDSWRNPLLPFSKRWEALHEPNGQSPAEFFYFDRKHHGVGAALLHFFTIYVRCIFPNVLPKWRRH